VTTINSGTAGITAAGRLIDRFIPDADVRERHETLIHAPPAIVFEVARTFDMQSIPLVRAIFWLRERLMGATRHTKRFPQGLVAETLGLGWGILAERPGRELVVGAVAQPWKPDVRFTPIPPDRFVAFAEPDQVKIVWTLESEPLEPALTLFRTETRAHATDEGARRKFWRYWRLVRRGVVLIRWLLLVALRREAERRYRAGRAA
jgi:hypothetical protein